VREKTHGEIGIHHLSSVGKLVQTIIGSSTTRPGSKLQQQPSYKQFKATEFSNESINECNEPVTTNTPHTRHSNLLSRLHEPAAPSLHLD